MLVANGDPQTCLLLPAGSSQHVKNHGLKKKKKKKVIEVMSCSHCNY